MECVVCFDCVDCEVVVLFWVCFLELVVYVGVVVLGFDVDVDILFVMFDVSEWWKVFYGFKVVFGSDLGFFWFW